MPIPDQLLPRYPMELRGRFEDARGAEYVTIRNDGHDLVMRLRGIELSGYMLDDFAPVETVAVEDLPFTMTKGCVDGYVLTIELPAPLIVDGIAQVGSISARLDLMAHGRKESFRLRLEVPGGRVVQSSGASGWIADELDELRTLLPADVRLLNCHGCALSIYSPAGFGAFGCLGCFRDSKDRARAATTKREIVELYPSMSQWVQETHLCPE